MHIVMGLFLILHAAANCLTFLLANNFLKALSGRKVVAPAA